MDKPHNYNDHPHLGYFNRGSRWRFTRDTRIDQQNGAARKGAEFTVGTVDYRKGVIPVTQAELFSFADRTSERRAGKHITGSIEHRFIWRWVECIDFGPNPIAYLIRNDATMSHGDRFLAPKDDWTYSVAEARFYQSKSAAMKALVRATGWERGWWGNRPFTGAGFELAAFDARTGEVTDEPAFSRAMLGYMNRLCQTMGASDRRDALRDVVSLYDNKEVVAGTFAANQRQQIAMELTRLKMAKLAHFRGIHGNTILFASEEDAVATKMVSQYPITLQVFDSTPEG